MREGAALGVEREASKNDNQNPVCQSYIDVTP